jgi:hypothetical protein
MIHVNIYVYLVSTKIDVAFKIIILSKINNDYNKFNCDFKSSINFDRHMGIYIITLLHFDPITILKITSILSRHERDAYHYSLLKPRLLFYFLKISINIE